VASCRELIDQRENRAMRNRARSILSSSMTVFEPCDRTWSGRQFFRGRAPRWSIHTRRCRSRLFRLSFPSEIRALRKSGGSVIDEDEGRATGSRPPAPAALAEAADQIVSRPRRSGPGQTSQFIQLQSGSRAPCDIMPRNHAGRKACGMMPRGGSRMQNSDSDLAARGSSPTGMAQNATARGASPGQGVTFRT